MTALQQDTSAKATTVSIIAAVSLCHMLNDIMQSMLAAIYPLLKADFALSFAQIGVLTLAFQITASLLQPLIGIVTDKRPMPYSLPVGMGSTLIGLVTLSQAHSYGMLVAGACLIGFGSAIFHPEASRVARLAAGGRFGFAQSFFQVGGNAGTALGPLLAAFIVVPNGQRSVILFAGLALLGIAILGWVARWYAEQHRASKGRPAAARTLLLPRNVVLRAVLILVLLTTVKNVYMSSFSSYFTFYAIDRFGLDVQASQLMLFLFFGAAAAGTFLGGPIGDRFGARFVIWFSILGVIPFALILPYANLFFTGVLAAIIGFVLASAFPAIVVFAQELLPGRVGFVGGLFFGFAFGAGGLGAALLGGLADEWGIANVYWAISLMPILGLATIFLPRLDRQA